MAIAASSPIPGQSHTPTIGWPRCGGQRELLDPVRQLERRRDGSMTNVRITSSGDDLARERRS